MYMYRVSKKKSPLTKYDTIAPNLEINEIHFRDIDGKSSEKWEKVAKSDEKW